MSIDEATVSNMGEIAVIVELLEQKGFCTKQDLHTIIDESRRKNPRVRISETACPESYLTTETGNTISDDILNSFNTTACWAASFRQARPLSSDERT